MSKDDDYEYLYSAEDIRILEKYLGHKVKNIKVKINSESILIHKYKLNNTVKNIMANSKAVLSNDIISQIYNKLLPYSQVDETIKKQHIANIKN